MLDLPAGHRCDLDQPAGGLRSGSQADLEDAAQSLREPLAAAARFRRGRGEFLGEERVPVGAPDDGVDKGRAGRCAGDGGQQFDEFATLEPLQVDALDARLALGLGQPRCQRMAAMQFVTAEGRDHEKSLVACIPRQEGEQVTGRTVGPVHVLDDEQDGIRLTEPAEQPQRPLEDAGLEPFGLARQGDLGTDRRHLGDQPGELWQARSSRLGDRVGVDLAGQRAKGFDDRPEREPILAERDRATLDDQPVAITQTADGLFDQAALADPGLATDERRDRDGRRQPNRPSRGAFEALQNGRRRSGCSGAGPCPP